MLQRQSVDFALRAEHFPTGAVPVEDQVIFVPLNIARKEPLTGLSVFDEDRRAVSLLNTAENAALATPGSAR